MLGSVLLLIIKLIETRTIPSQRYYPPPSRISLSPTVFQRRGTPTPSPTPLPPTPTPPVNVPELSIPQEEVLFDKIYGDNIYAYSLSTDNNFSVYRKTLNGQIEGIFNNSSAEGNVRRFYSQIRIDISPDNQKIAYSSDTGIYIYELQSKETKRLIKLKERADPNSERPNKWSNETESQTFSFYGLGPVSWSSDEKYISFVTSNWEGVGQGIVNTTTSEIVFPVIKDLNYGAGGFGYRWSPKGHQFLKYNADEGYQQPGLFISVNNGSFDLTDITAQLKKLESQSPESWLVGVLDANFSHMKNNVVFVYDPLGTHSYNANGQLTLKTQTKLGVIDIYGIGLTILLTGNITKSQFYPNDDSILFIQQYPAFQVLSRYSISSKNIEHLLKIKNDEFAITDMEWLDENTLILKGDIKILDSNRVDNSIQRFILVNLSEKKVVYASPELESFNFLGFVD